MNKVLNHIKNNFAIYLIIIACVVIISITLYMTRHPAKVKVDTSLYNVVNIKEALNLFKDDDPKLLIVSTEDCSATANYTKTLNYIMIEYDFPVYYLDLSATDSTSDEYNEFVQKLDFEYKTKDGQTGPFGSFMGATPMNIIIKNKKMVYGYIGSMSTSALSTMTENYGVSHGKKN